MFAQDLQLWRERKRNDAVRKVLVELREFNPSSEGEPDAFHIAKYAVGTSRDSQSGQTLFTDASQVSLSTLIQRGVLPLGSNGSFVRTNELFEHRKYFPQIAAGAARTSKAVI
ncbi:MAG: hypothetical protein U1E63_11375 [Burkholderiales bacterium]